jgi:hypothetical protein
MKLLWHIAWKDFRRLRWLIGLFAAVIAVKLGLGAGLLWANDDAWFRFLVECGNWVIGLEVLLGYALVAALIHEDRTIGASAFWMTRPISGGRLLAAKLLGWP